MLYRCLHSLRKTRFRGVEIIIVDNGSADGSLHRIQERFPGVRVVRSEANRGFAGGCNLGIRSTNRRFVVLLNNDTQVSPWWLDPLVGAADADSRVAAVQPKLRSIADRRRFDYCGAAGGEIDLFGYPYAWGRLFGAIEDDHGQYDRPRGIFWATGAAVLLRRSALDRVGLLDEAFFAHMEEIDLAFRLHRAGFRIVVEPRSLVYHQTGGTLAEESYRKMVLNHRNNLIMMLKNHGAATLCWLFPMRLVLEALTVAASLVRRDWKRAAAVPAGFFGMLRLWRTVADGRKRASSLLVLEEGDLLHRMYRGSVALEHFLAGVSRADDLCKNRNRVSGKGGV